MIGSKMMPHVSNSYLSNVRPVVETNAAQNSKLNEKPKTMEFKFTPSVDKITASETVQTGTYNNQGKLGYINDKMIVYVQPSAFIRDRLVPFYKATS